MLRKRRCYSEVYNDLWSVVVNVFQVLRDEEMAMKLIRQLELTPFSREEFKACGDAELSEIDDPVERARRTILRSFAGFGSAATNAEHATGFRATSFRSGTTPAHDWRNYPKNILQYVERLRGVVIENKHYAEILTQHDSRETLHYVDPPYVHSTRNMKRGNAAYAHEFTDDDHRDLAETLKSLKGMVVLSGYKSDLYAELYEEWTCVKQDTFADGAREREERLWLNPWCMEVRGVLTLF